MRGYRPVGRLVERVLPVLDESSAHGWPLALPAADLARRRPRGYRDKMYGHSARFGRIPATIAGGVRALIARKGPWFLINQLVFGALAVWLVFVVARSSVVFERQYLYVR